MCVLKRPNQKRVLSTPFSLIQKIWAASLAKMDELFNPFATSPKSEPSKKTSARTSRLQSEFFQLNFKWRTTSEPLSTHSCCSLPKVIISKIHVKRTLRATRFTTPPLPAPPQTSLLSRHLGYRFDFVFVVEK